MTWSSSCAVCEVAAERLLDDDARPAACLVRAVLAVERAAPGESRGAELLDQHLELARRRGQVEHAVAARALAVELVEHRGEALEALRVVELALHVPRRLQQAVAEVAVDDLLPVVVVDRLAHEVAELVVGHLLAAVADQRGAERQHAVAAEVVERRDQLAVGEVAGDAEHDQAAGVRVALAAERRGRPGGLGRAGDVDADLVAVVWLVVRQVPGDVVVHRHSFSLTAWPPNSLRRAASTFPLNVSVWRERKRVKSAAEIAGIGTLWAIACSTVQRPSPVSST